MPQMVEKLRGQDPYIRKKLLTYLEILIFLRIALYRRNILKFIEKWTHWRLCFTLIQNTIIHVLACQQFGQK